MKIRMGFVSNSSSASYIIEVGGLTFDELLHMLDQEYSWKYFDYDKIKSEIDNKYYKTLNLSKHGQFHGLKEDWIREATEEKERFDKINNEGEELVRFVLSFRGISVEELPNKLRLTAFTFMHNDYDDMPDLLREIIMFILMETKYPILGHRIGDG